MKFVATAIGHLGSLFWGLALPTFLDSSEGRLAEAVRFELTEGINPRRFSRPVP
jgi:hypothetical protein